MNTPDYSHKDLEGRSILYIDDEYVNYLYFSELLSETGATILRAYSLHQAIIRIRSEHQLCLVMISASANKRMSNQIVSRIRQIAPNIPMIGIIGNDDNEESESFLKIGCDLYLNRYIDNIHLIEIVNELLEGSSNK